MLMIVFVLMVLVVAMLVLLTWGDGGDNDGNGDDDGNHDDGDEIYKRILFVIHTTFAIYIWLSSIAAVVRMVMISFVRVFMMMLGNMV